jgi:signal transduction histidine kinase/ActR/RegA family two-component response regulator
VDLLEKVSESEREEVTTATNLVEASNLRTVRGARKQAMSHLLPLAVLVVFVAAALGAFVVTRKLVVDQEERLLTERAGEVAALLSNSVGSIESQLRVLGQVGASSHEEATELFTEIAGALVGRGSVTIGVATEVDGGFVLVNAVGDGPEVGEPLDAGLASLAGRAITDGGLVSTVLTDEQGTRLILALPVGSSQDVAYQVSILDPTTPAPSTPESPYRELQVALYASTEPDPSQLILTTEADLHLTGPTEQVPLPVGVDTWLLVVGTREPLVGSFALNVPWILLGGGLVTAVLAGTVAETLVRRRQYAFALVTARTRELEVAHDARREAQEAAEAANHAKSVFLSRMSHELRTPLNSILGFGQLLELEDLGDGQRDSVGQILKGGRHLLALINEVLDISRIEAGELSLSPEPVLVSDLIQEAVDLIRPSVKHRGIQLVVDRSGVCDCYVFADRQRFKQVLLNLLSNAVKYNRPRGTIALSCRQLTDTRISVSVADTGYGIAAERLGLLFIPFERLGVEGGDVEGTGIGLALSKRLAEAMGGTVSATSTLGQGSTFTLELPRVEGPVERYERLNGDRQPSAASTSRSHRILHIEDNLSNLKLIEKIFAQRSDVEVVAAMHGSLGLELAHENRPSLILLDLHLPDIDGEQVLQRLRDDPITASIPVVIVSADATPGQIQRLLAAGATSYITKPIDVRELLDVFDRTVGD